MVQVITVPMTLNYLGEERYGLWVAIASLIAFLQLSDLGISNALIGIIAKKNANNQNDEIKSILISSVKLLTIIAIIVVLLGGLVIYIFDWVTFLNVKNDLAKSELELSMLALLLFFGVNLPLGLVQQVRLGLQEGHTNATFIVIGQIINLSLILIVISKQWGMPSLIVASSLGTTLLNFTSLLLLLNRLRKFTLKYYFNVIELFKKGSLFFILQIGGVLSYQIDALVISHFLNPSAVTEYSIAFKIFSIPGMLLSFFFVGMWPAYADAFARNEKMWIKNYFWRSLKLSFISNTFFSLLLFFTGSIIINFWTKGMVVVDDDLLKGMMFWGILNAFGGNIATLLNGLHVVRFQIFIAAFATFFNIILSIFLVINNGVSGPIWGSVIVLTVQYIICIIYIFKVFQVWKNEANN